MANKVNTRIDMLALSILNKKDCYGYEIVKLMKEISNGSIDIKEGTLYPIIYKMLQKNYISGYNVLEKNRNRVYYHLEQEGKDYLNEVADIYLKNSKGVYAILEFGGIMKDESK